MNAAEDVELLVGVMMDGQRCPEPRVFAEAVHLPCSRGVLRVYDNLTLEDGASAAEYAASGDYFGDQFLVSLL